MDIEKKMSDTLNTDRKGSSTDAQDYASKNQLRHSFSVWSLASLCLCLMATWEALSTVVAAALTSGGAPCLFYNYVVSFLGSIAIASSLAEIASIYPTAGGQYHWVAMLAPQNASLIPSWFTAWISIGGQIVLSASAAFSAGLQFQALITLNNLDYQPQRWHGLLFYWLVLCYSLTVNLWGSKLLPHTNLASGILHIAALIAVLLILGIMAPKHNASYVFAETYNQSGWSNDGVSWLVGLVSAVYPFLGYDAAVHLSEEMDNPARNVPIAMVGSVVVNGILGLAYCVLLLFSLGDLDSLLASATGFPFIQLYLNVTQSQAGTTMIVLTVSFIAVAANAAGLTSTSRTAWALARDSALPFSSYFSHIGGSLHVPTRMIILVTVLQMLLGFIYLGSSTAFNAVLSMAILGVYASYLLPIIYMLLYGRNGGHEFGPFNLGKKFGTMLNIIAILWLLLAMLFSTFPSFQPVTAENMNYSVVVMGAWTVLGAAYFFVWGRKNYNGPVVEAVALATRHM